MLTGRTHQRFLGTDARVLAKDALLSGHYGVHVLTRGQRACQIISLQRCFLLLKVQRVTSLTVLVQTDGTHIFQL